jgi:hypothetical protein
MCDLYNTLFFTRPPGSLPTMRFYKEMHVIERNKLNRNATMGYVSKETIWIATNSLIRIYFSVFIHRSLCNNIFLMALPAHSGPRPLIQFRNHFSHTVGLLGRQIGSSQGRYINTRTTQTHTKLPCSERDSKPRSHHQSERREFMPKTARLLWPAATISRFKMKSF